MVGGGANLRVWKEGLQGIFAAVNYPFSQIVVFGWEPESELTRNRAFVKASSLGDVPH